MRLSTIAWTIGLATALGPLASHTVCAAAEPLHARLSTVHDAYPEPELPFDDAIPEVASDDSLAAAITEAFVSNPELAARRYDLRAIDNEIGLALAQLRPSAQLQVSGGYDFTVPGRITQASRPLSDQINSPNIERNDIATQLVIDQPLSTGGRARSAFGVAQASSAAGRETLRGIEGDLLVELIAAYSDVRRDHQSLTIREKNLRILSATLDEVIARREAGELTRTDIAQAEAQLLAAQVQRNAAVAQLEASRASFTAIVGREPGNLAAEPDLPGIPQTADEAFAIAELSNPDLAAAIATERVSRARIAGARAEARPQLSLRGTAGTTGPAVPFDRYDHDATFTARATLTIPLTSGGRVRSLVAQAQNRQSADALRVEAARRQMVQAIINAWNQWITAQRNVEAQSLQLRAARIYYEGTFEEYREGLRSTFDVLFAQNSARETEIALLASKRDRYVAQAVLLRRLGQLEVGKLIEGGPVYDPAQYAERVQRRSAMPWDGIVRTIDSLAAPGDHIRPLEQPAQTKDPAIIAPGIPDEPSRSILTHGPARSSSNASSSNQPAAELPRANR